MCLARVLVVAVALVLSAGGCGDDGGGDTDSTVASSTGEPTATIEPSGSGVDPASIAVVARLTALPGGRDELVEQIGSAFPAFEQEEGTLVYMLAEDATEADVLWLFEYYRDEEALDMHLAGEAEVELQAMVGDLTAVAPEVVVANPIRASGIPQGRPAGS